jgi:antitoxin (DNA-binding transcriptional repressor) of toxin-antitoxin stability system
VLNEVEYRGETFEVERHGQAVARITPTESGARGRPLWRDVAALLVAGPLPDSDFARDLDEVRRDAGRLPDDPWAHSSIARS